jgi:hypothetical protein
MKKWREGGREEGGKEEREWQEGGKEGREGERKKEGRQERKKEQTRAGEAQLNFILFN